LRGNDDLMFFQYTDDSVWMARPDGQMKLISSWD